jgi:translation initiation factor 2B subunit (eIF-2B alpha/beta/delta family)
MEGEKNEFMNEFTELVQNDVAVPVSAMKTLLSVIKKSNSATWMQLEQELRAVVSILRRCRTEDLKGRTKISLGSGCDLFMKYVTRSFLEFTVSITTTLGNIHLIWDF